MEFLLGNFNFQCKQNDFLNISNLHQEIIIWLHRTFKKQCMQICYIGFHAVSKIIINITKTLKWCYLNFNVRNLYKTWYYKYWVPFTTGEGKVADIFSTEFPIHTKRKRIFSLIFLFPSLTIFTFLLCFRSVWIGP